MTLSQTNSAGQAAVGALGQEQAYLDVLYKLLDVARERTDRALTQTHARGAAGDNFPLSMWSNRYGSYDDLARIKEWSAAGGLGIEEW